MTFRSTSHARLLALLAVMAGISCSRTPAPTSVSSTPPPGEEALNQLKKQVMEQGEEIAQLRALLAEERAKGAKLAADLASAKATSPAPVVMGNHALGSNAMSQILRSVGSMMTNPANIRTIRDGLAGSSRLQGRLYAEFLAQSDLSGEQRLKVERLLQQRAGLQARAGWGVGQAAQDLAENDRALREALGGRQFDRLQAYEEQMPAREFAERFNLFLEDRQAAMDPARKARLIDALSGLPDLANTGATKFSFSSSDGTQLDVQTVVDGQLNQAVDNYDRVVAAAQPVLSAEENRALDEYLAQRLQEREMGAQVARSLLPSISISNMASPLSGVTGTVSVQTIIIGEP